MQSGDAYAPIGKRKRFVHLLIELAAKLAAGVVVESETGRAGTPDIPGVACDIRLAQPSRMPRIAIGLFTTAAFSLFDLSTAAAAQCGGKDKGLKDPATCSRLFEFTGRCGHPNYDFSGWSDVAVAVGSWEKVPIRIVSVSADAIVYGRWHIVTGRIFAGDSFNDDPLTPLRYGSAGIGDLLGRVALSLHTEQHFRVDSGMQLPANQPWQKIHLDVHMTCDPEGSPFTGNLSVWYSMDGPAGAVTH